MPETPATPVIVCLAETVCNAFCSETVQNTLRILGGLAFAAFILFQMTRCDAGNREARTAQIKIQTEAETAIQLERVRAGLIRYDGYYKAGQPPGEP